MGTTIDDINGIGENHLPTGMTAHCTFSSKPPGGYLDYYAKMTTYANMISGRAQAIDPTATARSLAAGQDDRRGVSVPVPGLGI